MRDAPGGVGSCFASGTRLGHQGSTAACSCVSLKPRRAAGHAGIGAECGCRRSEVRSVQAHTVCASRARHTRPLPAPLDKIHASGYVTRPAHSRTAVRASQGRGVQTPFTVTPFRVTCITAAAARSACVRAAQCRPATCCCPTCTPSPEQQERRARSTHARRHPRRGSSTTPPQPAPRSMCLDEGQA